jgi:hypothetical protein
VFFVAEKVRIRKSRISTEAMCRPMDHAGELPGAFFLLNRFAGFRAEPPPSAFAVSYASNKRHFAPLV